MGEGRRDPVTAAHLLGETGKHDQNNRGHRIEKPVDLPWKNGTGGLVSYFFVRACSGLDFSPILPGYSGSNSGIHHYSNVRGFRPAPAALHVRSHTPQATRARVCVSASVCLLSMAVVDHAILPGTPVTMPDANSGNTASASLGTPPLVVSPTGTSTSSSSQQQQQHQQQQPVVGIPVATGYAVPGVGPPMVEWSADCTGEGVEKTGEDCTRSLSLTLSHFAEQSPRSKSVPLLKASLSIAQSLIERGKKAQ